MAVSGNSRNPPFGETDGSKGSNRSFVQCALDNMNWISVTSVKGSKGSNRSFVQCALDNMNWISVTNGFDNLLRRISVTVLNGSSVLARTTNGYDAASRLSTVSDGSNPATYSYVANSALVDHITFKRNSASVMTTSNKYDYLNRLTGKSSVASVASVVDFQYGYNAANQRTNVTLMDGSYWRYGYDALGQLTGSCKYFSDGTPCAGQQFAGTFDTIGNRTATQAGGDASGANLRAASYTNNVLNQIVQPGGAGRRGRDGADAGDQHRERERNGGVSEVGLFPGANRGEQFDDFVVDEYDGERAGAGDGERACLCGAEPGAFHLRRGRESDAATVAGQTSGTGRTA